MTGQDLPRNERLRGREQINALFAEGRVGKSRLILVRALPNNLGYSRVAAIAGKASGKAFQRNRLRRRIRAAYRTQKHGLPVGWDLVLLARFGVADADSRQLAKDLANAVRRATQDDKERSA